MAPRIWPVRGQFPGPKIKKGCKRAPPQFWGQLGATNYSFWILSLGPFWVSCFPLLNFEFGFSCLLSYIPPRHNSFFSFTRNRAISPSSKCSKSLQEVCWVWLAILIYIMTALNFPLVFSYVWTNRASLVFSTLLCCILRRIAVFCIGSAYLRVSAIVCHLRVYVCEQHCKLIRSSRTCRSKCRCGTNSANVRVQRGKHAEKC
jgi:hypothetical protein